MRNWILFTSLLVLIFGCATTPPKIEENRYVDQESGFSFEMPPTWKVVNRIPLILEDDINAIIAPEGCLILTNPSETAAILTLSFEHSFRWIQMGLDELTFVPTIESEQIEGEILKTISLKLKSEYRNLDIMPYGRRVTHQNWKANKEDFELRAVGGFVVPALPDSGLIDTVAWIYFYPCQGDKVHSLWLMLISSEADFSDNMKIFRALQSSIRAHDEGLF